jgi:hypothetical protein
MRSGTAAADKLTVRCTRDELATFEAVSVTRDIILIRLKYGSVVRCLSDEAAHEA